MAFFTIKNTKNKLGSKTIEEEIKEEIIHSATFEMNNHIADISESQAMTIPIFRNGIELISNSIAQLPLQLLVKKNNNNIQIIESDKRLNVLNKQSNKEMTSFLLKKAIIKDLILYGSAYLYRKNNEIYVLEAKNIQLKQYTNDNVTIERTEFMYTNSKGVHTFTENEIMYFSNGTNGILYECSETLESALYQQSYSKNIFKNGALPVGLLKASTRLTDKAIKSLRKSWEGLYVGSNKSGKTIILEEGLDYQPISLKPDELGLDKSSSRINSDIAKLLNIPLSMLDESANKYGSISTKNLLFLQTTISPLLKILEEIFNNYLLSENENQKGYEFRFNTNEFLRGTNEEQADLALKLFNNSAISYHEMRAILELNHDNSLDYNKDSIGSVYRYQDGTILNLNTQTKTEKEVA